MNSQLNIPQKRVLFLPWDPLPPFCSALNLLNPESFNEQSPAFHFGGKCTSAFSSLLSKFSAYKHFICEVDPREEITQSSRSEIEGRLFSSISKTIGSQKSVLLSSHLGLSQILRISISLSSLSCELMNESLHRFLSKWLIIVNKGTSCYRFDCLATTLQRWLPKHCY